MAACALLGMEKPRLAAGLVAAGTRFERARALTYTGWFQHRTLPLGDPANLLALTSCHRSNTNRSGAVLRVM
jgi:hypothetical protein